MLHGQRELEHVGQYTCWDTVRALLLAHGNAGVLRTKATRTRNGVT